MIRFDDTKQTSERGAGILPMLRTQLVLYARLEEFAKRQRTLISGGDAGPLLAVLADRQRLSAELADLGTSLAPFRCEWERHRGSMNANERDEADRLITETAACLRRVMDGDEQDVRKLAARRELVRSELQASGASRAAMAAYRPAGAGTTRTTRMDEAT